MADLTVSYVGLSLRNPLIAAPAGITETVERLKRAEDAGIGAAVMKSLFEFPPVRQAPTPRFLLLRHHLGRWTSFTLYSYEQASIFGPQEYAAEISRAKAGLGIPVIASVAGLTTEGWVEYARLCEQAGADALEVNFSCPHGTLMLAGADLAKAGSELLQVLRKQVSLPLIPKLTGQLTNPLAAALTLQEAGADAVVMFNRFTGLEIDLERERPIMHGAYAGHGGPWALPYVMRWISAAYPRLRIPISASGGVASGEDVAKLLLCGATTVQICTAMILQGYEVIGRLLQGLEEFMHRKGYASLEEFRGKICDHILDVEEVDRRRSRAARIDASKCNGCGDCYRVCFYRAVEPREQIYAVNPRCDGCGLCVQVCPKEAVSMVKREESEARIGECA